MNRDPAVTAALIGAAGTVLAAAIAAGILTGLNRPTRVSWIGAASSDTTCQAVCGTAGTLPIRASAMGAEELYVCRARTTYVNGTILAAGSNGAGKTTCLTVATDDGVKSHFECLCVSKDAVVP